MQIKINNELNKEALQKKKKEWTEKKKTKTNRQREGGKFVREK